MISGLLICASALLAGVFIGSAGVGGVLLVPALMAFSQLPIHSATATALFSFLFTGIAGTLLFRRRGSIDWRVTLPVCAGALALSIVGTLVASSTPPATLRFVVAAVIFAAGLYILASAKEASAPTGAARGRSGVLLGLGAVSGFGAGFSGAGGPLFSVPLMVVFGFEPLVAVATGQMVQVAAALSGSFGNAFLGAIDYRAAALITGFQLPGVMIGTWLAHRLPASRLRRLVGALCLAAAAALALRT